MVDAPINTRFCPWGLCLGLGPRGHRPAGRAGWARRAQRSSTQSGRGRRERSWEGSWPSRASGRTSQAEAWSETPRAASKDLRVLAGGGWGARVGPRGKRNCRARSGSTARVPAGSAGVGDGCKGTFLPLPALPWW